MKYHRASLEPGRMVCALCGKHEAHAVHHNSAYPGADPRFRRESRA